MSSKHSPISRLLCWNFSIYTNAI